MNRSEWLKRTCVTCGKEFSVIPARTNAKYCSKQCTSFKVDRKCETCNKIFHIQPNQLKHGEGRYCSRKCRFTGVKRNCVTCDNEFYVPNFRKNDPIRGKYCNRRCRFFQVEAVCEACGKHFMRQRTQTARFCSMKCYWSTSISPLKKQVRDMNKYRIWRRLVFERDEYTCQDCGKRGVYLHAHHIISFETIVRRFDIKTHDEAAECSQLWDIDNGKTLCVHCHTKTRNYGTKKSWKDYN